MYTLPQLTAFILTGAFGIAAHLVFKRFEPTNPHVLLALLILLPTTLSGFFFPYYSWFFVPISFTTYYLVLCTSILAYRVSPIHPLARYPGPMLNKISKLWAAWEGSKGKQYLHYEYLHRKYGDVVRIGPNELSIRDASVTIQLHGTCGLAKGPQHQGRLVNTSIPSLVSIRDRDLHTKRRKHWLRGLNSAALKGYEPIIKKRVQQLVEVLEGSSGDLDLSQLIGHFSYDFMSDMAFGGGSEMMRDGDVKGLWKLQGDAITVALFFGHIPWIAPFAYRLPSLSGNLVRFRQFGIAAAEKRKRDGSRSKDLFYHLIDEGGVDKEPPTLAQVVSDGSLAIIAGSDTTATVLSNLFYFLMGNSESYRRLQAEVDQYYPAGEDGTDTRCHTDMHYLSACIDESMRLLPPVPDGSQRASYKGSMMLGPYYIPEGTAVATHFYSIQRDPRNFFPGPDMFWPERWLIADGKLCPKPGDFLHNVSAFTPFSVGPANCVGKQLALQEMKTAVCSVMQRVELRFAAGYNPKRWLEEMEDYQILKRGRLQAVVTLR